jgi:hypothetical protein
LCIVYFDILRLFISKLQRRKLSLIQTRSLKKYFQIYKQAVGKFALNSEQELNGKRDILKILTKFGNIFKHYDYCAKATVLTSDDGNREPRGTGATADGNHNVRQGWY